MSSGGAIALPVYPDRRDEAAESDEYAAHNHGPRPEDENMLDDDEFATKDDEGDALLRSSNASSSRLPFTTGASGSKERSRSSGRRKSSTSEPAPRISRRTRITATTFILASAFLFIIFPAFLPSPTHHHTGMSADHDVRYSNGTHQFRKTVLMVSIDGLRADYLDRGLTPHLLNISQQGLRAKSMKPIFPTLTFPNHWSMLTGLYAESHGIVANDFYDPETNSKFHYHDSKVARQAHWWGGEPIWETASKAGLTTANLMWLGPWTTSTGVKSTYFVPWRNKVPLKEKHDQIFEWIDLPFDKRPQLILAYEPHLDQVGHQAGPYSDIVNRVLGDVDTFAKTIHTSLRSRNLSQIVDVIFVSDHGMTNTSNTRLVYMDDVMGAEHVKQIEHQEGWPSVGLRMSKDANMTDIIHRLRTSGPATSTPPAMDIFTAEDMPERFHFNPKNNQRIAPLYIVPRLGWALTNQHEHKVEMGGDYTPKGNHGYDNEEPSMHSMFVADGPFTTRMKRAQRSALRRARRPSTSPMLRRWRKQAKRLLGTFSASAAPAPVVRDERSEPEIIPTFNNVELYGLIVKLLDLQKFAAPSNGTKGFWDEYLADDDDDDD